MSDIFDTCTEKNITADCTLKFQLKAFLFVFFAKK